MLHRGLTETGAAQALGWPKARVTARVKILEAKAAAAATTTTARRKSAAGADPVAVAKRERDARLCDLADQGHGANLDLGHALIHNLSTVDPGDIDVARFFVLCGCPHRANYADRVTMPTLVSRWPFTVPCG